MLGRGGAMLNRLSLFRLAGLGFALPLVVLRRVVRVPAIYPIPLAGSWLPGVFLDEGDLVPVLDLQRWLSGGNHDGNAPYHAICMTELGPLALPAEQTDGIVDEAGGTWREIMKEPADDIPEQVFDFRDNAYKLVDVNELVRTLLLVAG